MKEKSVDIIGIIITWLVMLIIGITLNNYLINKCIKNGGHVITESLGVYKACILKEVE